MKRISLVLSLLAVLGLVSCEKKKQVGDFNNLGIGSYLTKVKVINDQLNYGDLNNTSVSVVVAEKGSPVDKITIYVTEGASKVMDRTKWKKIKDVTYSGETTLTTKATEIATALGRPVSGLVPGQTYMLYNQVTTKDGKVYDLSTTGSDFEGITYYNMALTFPAIIICPYKPAEAVGTWEVVNDQWADYSPGYSINVALGDLTDSTFKFSLYPNPAYGGANQKPVTVKVSKTTGAATVAKQIYGDYIGWESNMTVATTGSGNWVFSCSGSLILKLSHVGSSDYGPYTLQMKKK